VRTAGMTLGMLLLYAALLPWVAVSAVSLFLVDRFARDWQRHTARTPALPENPPEAAVIVPVKGDSPSVRASIEAYANLDYPRYRLLIAVEARDDPVYGYASALALSRPGRVGVIVAGRAGRGAQKVANQLAAWRSLPETTQVVCFGDADALPPPDWLAGLTAWILVVPDQALVSGYRWLMPADGRWSTRVACAINAGVATAMRHRRWNLAWGGAMGAHRALWRRIDFERTLDGVASDDLVLGNAVRRCGGYIEQVRDLLVPSPAAMDWAGCLGFIRRQYTMLWLYSRKHWLLGAAATTTVSLGWAAALLAAWRGWPWMVPLMTTVYALDCLRAWRRWRFAARKWSDAASRRALKSAFLVDAFATPLVMLVHALCVWSTLFRRRFEWAGISYDASNPARVIVVGRKTAA